MGQLNANADRGVEAIANTQRTTLLDKLTSMLLKKDKPPQPQPQTPPPKQAGN